MNIRQPIPSKIFCVSWWVAAVCCDVPPLYKNFITNEIIGKLECHYKIVAIPSGSAKVVATLWILRIWIEN
jgi:hypothetical protein